MSIYSRKQNWKIVLGIIAFVIVMASLFYSNSIVEKIGREERQKVKLWSQAILRKARLVKYTDELFTKLRLE
ncbi:MAG TPA: sensor histidine kinase, partial [Flavobacteriales bacterium]|nr:sensor histidine kinase [Flavobacteriales bacterium]